MRSPVLSSSLLVAALLIGVAAPAPAQQPAQPAVAGSDQFLVGVGLTFLDVGNTTGAGLAANALFNTFRTSELGRLGVIGDFGLNSFSGGTVVTLGGGIRYTFITSGTFRPYAQGTINLVRVPGDVRPSPGLGFGTDVAWRDNLNFRGELSFLFGDHDYTRWFFGVSLPVRRSAI